MNKLIKELAKEAHLYASEQYGKQRKGEIVWDPLTYDKKFAELIVLECIDICNAYSTIEGITNKIRDDIKETFGVEE